MLAIIATLFGLVFVFFPLKGRTAPADPAASAAPAKAAPQKGGKRGPAKGAASAAPADAAPTTSATPAPEPAPAKAKTDKDQKDGESAEDAAAKTLPTGKGLPVQVNVAVAFVDLKGFDDSKGEFECTTDLRLRWTDPRLEYPRADAFRGYKEFRGKDAEEQLGKMWGPTIEVVNRTEASAYVGRRVRIFADGTVELLTRTTAKHKVRVDPEKFPFDRQQLTLELLVREESADEVLFRMDRDDIEFSRVTGDTQLEGWQAGLVNLRGDAVAGWGGDRYSRVVVALSAERLPSSSLAPIFIPLVASLLIPLLAIWMNRATDDGFEVEAFELANMGIGGLFSVIALSFAIYSSYAFLGNSDNTVTRLFGLNYVSLALALAIVVLFFQYNVLLRLFGPYVQKEAFKYLTWALPVLSLATSIAFLCVAAA